MQNAKRKKTRLKLFLLPLLIITGYVFGAIASTAWADEMIEPNNELVMPFAATTSYSNLLSNASFENSTTNPWAWFGNCSRTTYSTSSIVKDGSKYLATAHPAGSDCQSMYQDINRTPQVGETAYFTIWMRSATSDTRAGRLTIWGLSGDEESNDTRFDVGTNWQCVTVELTVQNSGHTAYRAEIYLDESDGIDYYFDQASFNVNGGTLCPPPDLQIDSFTVYDTTINQPIPANGTVVLGTVINLEVEARNCGGTDITDNFDVQYYMNNSPIDDDEEGSDIDADCSDTERENDILTINQSGSLTFKVCLDSNNEIPESSEGNNCATHQINVIEPPDLQIDDFTVYDEDLNQFVPPNGTVGLGSRLELKVFSKNCGLTDITTDFQVEYYLENTPLFEEDETSNIDANCSEIEEENHDVVIDRYGLHTFKVCIDSNNLIVESDENNNCMTYQVNAVEADLQVNDLRIYRTSTNELIAPGSQVALGQEVKIEVESINCGGTETEQFEVHYFAQGVQVADDTEALNIDGNCTEVQIEWEDYMLTASGELEITVCIDTNAEVAETDETNNCATTIIEVVQAPIADFSAATRTGEAPLVVAFQNDSISTATLTYLWDFGDGQTSINYQPTHTYQQSGFYTVTLTVYGAMTSTTKTEISYIEVIESDPLQTVEIELYAGWNLIATPLQPEDTTPATLFQSINGFYSDVFTVDNCGGAGWQTYSPTNPPYANTISTISPTQGIWIEVSQNVTLTITGVPVESTNITVCPGWNLVGYPVPEAVPVETALSSIAGQYKQVFSYPQQVWKSYDPTKPPFANTLTELKAGLGYWIESE